MIIRKERLTVHSHTFHLVQTSNALRNCTTVSLHSVKCSQLSSIQKIEKKKKINNLSDTSRTAFLCVQYSISNVSVLTY